MNNLEQYYNKSKKVKKEIEKNVYKRRLLQKALTIFEWEGADINSRLFNLNLFTQGAAGIMKKDDKYIVIYGRDGGTPLPIGYGEKLVGMDYSGKIKANGNAYWDEDSTEPIGVICFNDSMGVGIYDIVERYAEALQIADDSINIAMLNTRISPLISASSKNAKDQIQLALNQVYDGKPHVFYDGAVASGMSENPLNELLNMIRQTTNISDLIEMRADIYSRFCIEIGIPVVNNTKRSQLISGEIGGINTLSLVNLKDMLKRREEFCDRFNAMYGENLSVKIADEYLIESTEEATVLEEDRATAEADEKTTAGTDDSNKEGSEE